MDISKDAWTEQRHKKKRMDFSDLYTMMGQFLKVSTKMDTEKDGEDISIQMECAAHKIIEK